MTHTEGDMMSDRTKSIKKVLEHLSNQTEWCIEPERLSAVTIDRSKQWEIIEEALNEIEAIITADRKRVALESRINELLDMSDLPYIGLRGKRLERLGDRIAQLKSKQEEV